MVTEEQVSKRVVDFVSACRQRGIKVTHQRTEILRELAGTEEHPDAETIYARVRQRLPTISLDTVYRTLRLLQENRVISRVGFPKERARFDANNDRHHHFVCSDCGLVRDFYSDALDHFPPPGEVTEMGSVDAVYVEMRGRCLECRGKRGHEGKTK